jgi:hypothetical protein
MEAPKAAGDPEAEVRSLLGWMRDERMWPNGARDLFTDAFGIVLLISMFRATGDRVFVEDAERIADALLTAPPPEPRAQHAVLFVYALWRLSRIVPRFVDRAIALARETHRDSARGRGEASPLDPFHGYVVYRLLDARALDREIGELRDRVEDTYGTLVVRQDLALGSMLWLTHFFPDEPWARAHEAHALEMLDRLWVDPPGYFCRLPGYEAIKYAFANHVIAIGLEAVNERPERRWLLREFFAYYRSGDAYDRDAVTHITRCVARMPDELLATSARTWSRGQ